MSNKSGISSQVITLPKGGGALHGIGEKFSPDLHTGTGNVSIPIALPPGRNGFQPQLSLIYSTGNGNGPFGLGWNLSIPGVSRKTSRGVPHYDNARDTFILSGAEDLVPVPGDQPGVTRYRPRSEGLFARIEHYADAAQDYWQVQSKDGLVSWYGTPAPAGNDAAVIANPLDRSRIFAWKLTRTSDPFGNRIEYEYQRDPVQADESHHWDQCYLSAIHYIDYGPAVNPQFLVTVRFTYDNRPDPFSEYRAGFEIRTVRRCRQIDVITHAGADVVVRTYQLGYLDQLGTAPLPLNGVSLLNRVVVVGSDGVNNEQHPPLEFAYTRFEPEYRDLFPITGSNLPAGSLARAEFELADLTGDGLPDILEMNGIVRFWRNMGGGRFDQPRAMPDAPAGLHLANPGVQLIDANGDSLVDLLVSTEHMAGYYPLQRGGQWDRRSFQRYESAPSFNLEDPEVRLVDLDGDGVTDAIRSGSRFEYYFNDPLVGWAETRRVERRPLSSFPNVNFSDPHVKWADMTGDGLQDIVLVYDGTVVYWPNLGYGNWSSRITMHNNPRLPYEYDPKRVLLGDIDGDGMADLVYIEDTQVTLWVNRCGNNWSDPIVITGTPPVTDMDAVRLVDLLGTGISGILWSSDAGELQRERIFFLDFTRGTKPYLLAELDNHMGALTRIAYAPSTRYYLEDERRPATRWKTALPFPVQVVARVEVLDAISGGKLTTEYSYHHGYWDGNEREFRGFGRVDQRDSERFDEYHAVGAHGPDRPFAPVSPVVFSPPTELRTWFHQGPIGDAHDDWVETDFSDEFWAGDPQVLARPPSMTELLKTLPRKARRDALRTLRGRIIRTELYALDDSERQNRPYTVTESLHGVTTLPIGAPLPDDPEPWRMAVFFPHPLAERTTQWERGDEPMTRFRFLGAYDAYGQAGIQTSITVPRGRDFRVAAVPGAPYLATYMQTDYAQRDDPQRYIVDRVARTTTHEIVNDGNPSLFMLLATIQSGAGVRRIIGQTLNFYDGQAFQGEPYQQLGDYGALVRTENLVLTIDILHEAYKSGAAVLAPPEEPPYLVPNAAPAWTAEYPQEYRARLPQQAGYIFQPGGAGSPHATGYFAVTERRRYDFQTNAAGTGRGQIAVKRDPLGNDTAIGYDGYDLLPTQVSDPAGTVRASYDYRYMQPQEYVDPNQNRTVYSYTPLSLLASVAVLGKQGEARGDSLAVPGTRFLYDFLAFTERGQPISLRTVRRVQHVNDAAVPLSDRDEIIETIEYSDGFGRLLQSRTQAEDITFGDVLFGDSGLPLDAAAAPGDAVGQRRITTLPPRVVVSGWQIYNNKGRVVEKYEPFFAAGWEYTQPGAAQRGQQVALHYDPRGEVVRVVNPDGSEKRVVHGIPGSRNAPDVSNPDTFEPTPWEAYTYDTNDNAGRTHPGSAGWYQEHWNTPTSAVVDALGRTVVTTERNGPDPANDWYTTSSTYDIHGNLIQTTDTLGRTSFRIIYDLAQRPLRIEQLDAGLRRTVFDAAGNPIERRDSKGALVLRAYDQLHRTTHLWARDGSGQAVALRERLIYGDAAGLGPAQAAARNLVGKLYRHYDEAGLLEFESYDFKGNVLERVRQVIDDGPILAVFNPPPPNWDVAAFRVDWQPPPGMNLDAHAGGLLDAMVYRTSFQYDALNRIRRTQYPQDVSGVRKELRPYYNRAGALERVEFDGITYAEHIAYNAKGQRSLIVYANGLMTRYAYEPATFRLARLRTERYTRIAQLTYRPTGAPLQDYSYSYDLEGNVLAIGDRVPGSGIPGSVLGVDRLDRIFTYDPLYRLRTATGRECATPAPAPPWEDTPRCHDVNLTRAYAEEYTYDRAGNLTRLRHTAGVGSFTRDVALVPNSNRLASLTRGAEVHAYTYDPAGNLLSETTSRHFEWDHSDRMRVYRTQTAGAEPSVHAHYLYDGSGARVKKLVRKQGGRVEVTVSIDDLFEHHRIVQGANVQQNNTIHIMDDERRIALIRVGASFPGDASPAVTYHLGDHLDSAGLVVDSGGAWINREEFTPYGETSFGSFARKRYRFTGKERDEESGLTYHGARYYAPWLARWISCDPVFLKQSFDDYLDYRPYTYVENRPLVAVDPDGELIWFVVAAVIVAVVATPQIANAPAPGQRTYTRSTGELALNMTENASMMIGAAGLVRGGAAVIASQGLRQGSMTIARNVAIGRVRAEITQRAANVVDPTGTLGRLVNVAQAVRGAIPGRTPRASSLPGSGSPPGPRSPAGSTGARANAGSGGRGGSGSGGGGGDRPPIHSRYADGTSVYEGQQPPRLGPARPDPSAQGPHTQLRWDTVNNRVYQGREFDASGRPVRDIDFTSPTFPNGSFRPDHLPPPHQHRWTPNPTGGSPTRSRTPEPLD